MFSQSMNIATSPEGGDSTWRKRKPPNCGKASYCGGQIGNPPAKLYDRARTRASGRLRDITSIAEQPSVVSSPIPARIGINAQLLSSSKSYRAAGSSRYVFNLLRELRDLAPPETILAYLGERGVPPGLDPLGRFD